MNETRYVLKIQEQIQYNTQNLIDYQNREFSAGIRVKIPNSIKQSHNKKLKILMIYNNCLSAMQDTYRRLLSFR